MKHYSMELKRDFLGYPEIYTLEKRDTRPSLYFTSLFKRYFKYHLRPLRLSEELNMIKIYRTLAKRKYFEWNISLLKDTWFSKFPIISGKTKETKISRQIGNICRKSAWKKCFAKRNSIRKTLNSWTCARFTKLWIKWKNSKWTIG